MHNDDEVAPQEGQAAAEPLVAPRLAQRDQSPRQHGDEHPDRLGDVGGALLSHGRCEHQQGGEDDPQETRAHPAGGEMVQAPRQQGADDHGDEGGVDGQVLDREEGGRQRHEPVGQLPVPLVRLSEGFEPPGAPLVA